MKPDKATLENLYLSQRLTTRVIGAQFGVSKTEVLRWLRADDIACRTSGRGLAHRGVVEPSADELYNLVHTHHLSYKAIAARFGVDYTAIPHWLTRHNIQKPNAQDTRFKGNRPRIHNIAECCALYEAGASTVQLAEQFGVNAKAITKALRAAGTTIRPGGFKGKRFACNDGHVVMSIYEQRVDNWLSFHGLSHEVEPRLPFNQRCRGDFLVNGVYIEVWGVKGSPIYLKRRKYKTEEYRKHGLQMIELQAHDFESKRVKTFDKILAKAFLEKPNVLEIG